MSEYLLITKDQLRIAMLEDGQVDSWWDYLQRNNPLADPEYVQELEKRNIEMFERIDYLQMKVALMQSKEIAEELIQKRLNNG